jgi:asparagine synthase (glutamine-hydrolysing)
MNKRYQRASRLLQFNNTDDLFVHIWSQEQYMFTEKEISNLLGSSYRNETVMTDWEKINAMDIADEEKISLFDITNYLSYNLLYKMDSASMANSLEVRTPYLDYRVVEFALNLPLEFKIKGNTQKYNMKK